MPTAKMKKTRQSVKVEISLFPVLAEFIYSFQQTIVTS
ncbi:Hypothetical protein ABZS17D1_00550 [Kosakonia cowanii]